MSDIKKFLDKIASWETLDEVTDTARDDDEKQELYEEFKTYVGDKMDAVILEARYLLRTTKDWESKDDSLLTEAEAGAVIEGFQTGEIDALDLMRLVDDPDIWIEESDTNTAKSLREGRKQAMSNEELIADLLDIKSLFKRDRDEALGIVTDLAYRWADLTDDLVEALKKENK